MAKSMKDRKLWIGGIYEGVLGRNPVLKKGLFKPDLKAPCDNYDKNKDAYDRLVERKAKLGDYLKQMAAAMQTYMQAVGTLAAERAKVYAQNGEIAGRYGSQLNGFIAKGDDADTDQVVAALKGFTASFKQLVELDKAHADRKEKLDSQWEQGLKKICDAYEKEAKEIKTAISKIETDEDRLEAQIRQLVLNYQKLAVQIDNSALEGDLEKVIAGFG